MEYTILVDIVVDGKIVAHAGDVLTREQFDTLMEETK